MAGCAAFCAAQPVADSTVAITDSTSTAAATVLGTMIKGSLSSLENRGIEIDYDVFAQTLGKVLKGESTGMTPQEADEYMSAIFMAHAPAAAKPLDAAEQAAFVAEAAAAEGAVLLPGGTVMQIITEGEGAMPQHGQSVKVRYTGKLADGTVFDEQQQDPVDFDVDGLIAGFTEGLLQMRPGGTYRLVIPADQGYGDRGVPGVIPPGAALDFIVTLEQ